MPRGDSAGRCPTSCRPSCPRPPSPRPLRGESRTPPCSPPRPSTPWRSRHALPVSEPLPVSCPILPQDEFHQFPVCPGEREPRSRPGKQPPRILPRRHPPFAGSAQVPVEGDPVVGIGMGYGSHFPLNRRAHAEFLPQDTSQGTREGFAGFPSRGGERPHPA